MNSNIIKLKNTINIYMDDIIRTYNNSNMEKRKDFELEIRYTEKTINRNNFIDILNQLIKKYKVTEHKFIDNIKYTKDNTYRERTFINNKKIDRVEKNIKTLVKRHYSSNIIGKYSIVLSEEKVDDSITVNNFSDIILKRRFSYNNNDYKDWRVDINIYRKCESSLQPFKQAYKSFFIEINSYEELLKDFNDRFHIYKYSIEIEYIGNKNIQEEDINNISMIPFNDIDNKIKDNILKLQEVNYLEEMLNTNNDSNRRHNVIKNIRYILPNAKVLTKQIYQKIYPPVNFLLKEKTDGIRTVISIHDRKCYITNEHSIEIIDIKNANKVCIVECEKVENDIVVYDVLFYNGETMLEEGIENRILKLNNVCEVLSKNIEKYNFIKAEYYSLSNPQRYKVQIEEKMKYNKLPIDGLIFVQKEQSYKQTNTYKWKPIKDQTIDFLCKKLPDHLVKPGSYTTKDGHDIYILYTTASRHFIENLKLTTNYGYNQMFKDIDGNHNIPIPFYTPFVPTSYIYFITPKTQK